MKKYILILAACAGLANCSCQKEIISKADLPSAVGDEFRSNDIIEVRDYYDALCTQQESVKPGPREDCP